MIDTKFDMCVKRHKELGEVVTMVAVEWRDGTMKARSNKDNKTNAGERTWCHAMVSMVLKSFSLSPLCRLNLGFSSFFVGFKFHGIEFVF